MNQFIIAKNCWYAWQMIPGYVGERSVPYCSLIYVTDFKPLKTGSNLVNIEFINVSDLIYLEIIKKIVAVGKGS